ncbi:Chitin deacetylase [Colletotrichum trifolii]|uniref:Chitin deacetylase n=1 Tax=Colletotrichum trifolii TaxID=5466 RepID=A0A4R8Q7Y4_COLTR|nr:Chitin deacetylase [Colletotrichum trifolii]
MAIISSLTRLLGLFGTAQAVCSNLAVDGFSRDSPSGLNDLQSWASDDQSMASVAVDRGVLSFTPKTDNSSYFYETLGCVKAATNGYDAITLTIRGPRGASMMLEVQTKASCSESSYSSQWTQITGLTGSTQIIIFPLRIWQHSILLPWYFRVERIEFPGVGNNTALEIAVANNVSAFLRNHRKRFHYSGGLVFRRLHIDNQVYSIQHLQTHQRGFVFFTVGSFPVLIFFQSVFADQRGSITVQLRVGHRPAISRLTFLFYNSMLQPSSDDGTMKEIAVSNNRVTLTPSGQNSYFYSKTACTNAQVRGYGGISMRIKAARGTTFSVQLASSAACSEDSSFGFQSSKELGWTFDGTEKLYHIPFTAFPSIDRSKVSSILFASLSAGVTIGPMAFYCGNSPSEFVVKATTLTTGTVATVPAPSSTTAVKIIDSFARKDSNALGYWHGGDVDTALTWGSNKLTIKAPDADFAFYTQLSDSCADMTAYDGSYLHVSYSGSNKFTIALQQHNQQCNDAIAPFPETWDSIEAARYATGNNIYIPMSHFNIERRRVVGLAFKGFYTREAVTLNSVRIVSSVPNNIRIPAKLSSGNLVFACKRPNSIAFAIDDGDPKYAQEVMEIIRSENIKVTFFTVGAPLRDVSTNLSTIYQDMMTQGHQMALHSYTHPRMEGLPNDNAIFWEYDEDVKAVSDMFDGLRTKYFRPPFGNEGARMRQQLVKATGSNSPYIVNWNIDVEDWLWAQSDTPEKQLESFQRDLDKGGSLVVMHYLYPSTVSYLRQFIQKAKATGKQLMRVDQCMMDPDAPPL